MDCCSSTPQEAVRAPCPSCGQVGSRVQAVTVESIAKPELAAALEGVRRFCRTKGCDTLYYDGNGRSIPKGDARVRVGLKETDPPIPICYCFGFSRADIEREIAESGECTIAARITLGVKAGTCACETKNPAGVCCLREVREEVKEAMLRGAR